MTTWTERYKELIEGGQYISAARVALESARDWVDMARQAAQAGGMDLDSAVGRLPDLDGMERQIEAAERPPLIVTKHAGAVEWLRRRGITGDVVKHATADEVRGRVVYGVLPLHLASLATGVVAIDMPGLPPERRGQELSPEEMDAYGAKLTRYQVRVVEAE